MMKRLKVTLLMVAAKLAVAGLTISYKLVLYYDVMHLKVLITYRYLFASLLMFPLALFLERNQRPKLTWRIFFQAFLCAIFGGPMAQNMYASCLILTSATFAAAFTNLIPPFTFIIAVMFRLENIKIGKTTGKAKVIGTIVGVAGAMILTFYKGHQLNIKLTDFNILRGGHGHVATTHKTYDHIRGSILALVYSLSIALYYTLQSKLSVKYPCHYSNTFLFSLLGFIQSLMYTVLTERSWSKWTLASKIRILSVIFQGVCSMLAVVLTMAAVHLQGPLFVSVFNPLVLVFVAITGFLVLGEQLYVGSLLGSVIIIAGLYLVLWGKSKETKRLTKLTPSDNSKDVNDATTVTTEVVSMARTSFSISVDESDEICAKSTKEKHEEDEIVEEV